MVNIEINKCFDSFENVEVIDSKESSWADGKEPKLTSDVDIGMNGTGAFGNAKRSIKMSPNSGTDVFNIKLFHS